MASRHTKTNTDTLRAATELFDRLQEIVDLVARVLAKFPSDTLPEQLKPFRGAPKVAMVRPFVKNDGEIVVTTSNTWYTRQQLRIPGEWLQMHQSQITSAVREIYWADKNYRDMYELHRLGRSIKAHDAAVHKHTKAAERERDAYRQLAARISTRRRGSA